MKNSMIMILSVKQFITMIISRTKQNGGFDFFNPFVRNRKVT